MPYIPSRDQAPAVIENLQEFYSGTLEYYDELFPLGDQVLPFILKIRQEQVQSLPTEKTPMCRFLGIGCATGNLENKLSGYGMDITGIDQNANMIETAKRRMKRGFSTIRFFEMSAIDIRRFLKKGSFNIIACIGNVLPYISDETLMKKFFYDVRELLAPGGKFIVQTINYDALATDKPVRLPDRSSVRVTLSRGYIPAENGQVVLDALLEQGNGKKLSLQHTTKLIPMPVGKVKEFAREAGFTESAVYGDFGEAPWSSESPISVIVLSLDA